MNTRPLTFQRISIEKSVTDILQNYRSVPVKKMDRIELKKDTVSQLLTDPIIQHRPASIHLQKAVVTDLGENYLSELSYTPHTFELPEVTEIKKLLTLKPVLEYKKSQTTNITLLYYLVLSDTDTIRPCEEEDDAAGCENETTLKDIVVDFLCRYVDQTYVKNTPDLFTRVKRCLRLAIDPEGNTPNDNQLCSVYFEIEVSDEQPDDAEIHLGIQKPSVPTETIDSLDRIENHRYGGIHWSDTPDSLCLSDSDLSEINNPHSNIIRFSKNNPFTELITDVDTTRFDLIKRLEELQKYIQLLTSHYRYAVYQYQYYFSLLQEKCIHDDPTPASTEGKCTTITNLLIEFCKRKGLFSHSDSAVIDEFYDNLILIFTQYEYTF